MQTAAEIKAAILGGAQRAGPMPLEPVEPVQRLGDMPPPDPVSQIRDQILAGASQPEPRGAFRRFAAGTGEAFLGLPGTVLEGVGIATGSEGLQEAGAALQPEFVRPVEEGVIANLGRVLGSGAGFGGIAAGGARVAGMAGALGSVGTAGAASAIPEAFYEAQASGASEEDAWKAAMVSGLGQGALEILGPELLIGKIATALAKADRATGGAGRDLLLSTAGEAAEEGAQSLWADIAAQDIIEAVPDEPWAERFKQAAVQAGYGAFGGGVLGSLALASERAAREAQRPPEPPPEQAPYSPIERALTPEEESAVEAWREKRGATKAEVVERPELEEAVALARQAGVEVLFVEDDSTAPKMDAQYEAGTIIMDARLDPASVGLFTGIHESIHGLPKSKRDALVKDLAAFSSGFRARYGDKADREGLKLTKAALDEEGVADLAGALAPIVRRVMRNPAGAMRVMTERPSLMRQIIDMVGGIFGKKATPEQLEQLAEVSDRLALAIKPRERVQLAQKIVAAFQGIQAQATAPVKVKRGETAEQPAVNPERGMVPVPNTDRTRPKGVAAQAGAQRIEERAREMAAQVQRENETYRPGAIRLGPADPALAEMPLQEIQRREREAEAFEREETDLTLRGAGFTRREVERYTGVRRRARLAQRALDMAETERNAREARTELESAALELRRFEDRLTGPERERLRAGADPEMYARLREARTSGLEARYGDVIEGSARERELQEQERRGVERAVPSVRYSLGQDGKKYRYRMQYRPPSFETLPRGIPFETEPASSENPFGVVVYSKPLPFKDETAFQLEPLDPAHPKNIRKTVEARRERLSNALTDQDTIEGELGGAVHFFSPDLNRPDRFRLTRFDQNGTPTGHIELGELSDALDEVSRMGFEPKRSAIRYSLRQTSTPEFKRWFGNSKVVDGEGKPLVVYHGVGGYKNAPRNFNEFRKSPFGIYFTPDLENLDQYVTNNEEAEPSYRDRARVYPVFLTVKRPYIAKYLEASDGISSERIEELKSQGYDGIFEMPEGSRSRKASDAMEIIVFEPTQIKSATGNRGTFDPANPDIRYSLKSDIESLAADIAEREPASGYRLAAGPSMAERAVRAVVREQNPPDVRSVEEVEDDASKHLATPAARGKLVQRLLQGEMLNDAETLAAKEITSDLLNDAWAGRADMQAGVAVEQMFQFLRTEQARALGNPALRDAYQSPADRLRSYMFAPTTKVQKALKKAKTWQQRRAIFEREAKRVERIRYALAERGWDPRLLTDDYYKEPNFVAAYVSTVDKFSGQRWKDAYIRWRRATLLSGPQTTIRNVLGSLSYATYDRVLRMTADAMVPGSETNASDVRDYVRDLLAAAPQAWQEAKGYYRDFYSKTMDGTTIDDKKGARNVKGGLARTAVEAVGVRVQSATDIFFRRMIEAAEIKLRQRQGLADWDEVAKADMERALFLDRDSLTRAVTTARDWADTYAPIGTTLIPFASTPTKIIQRSAEIAAGPLAALWRERERRGTALLGLATWGAILWIASMFDDEDGLPLVTGTRDRNGRGEFQDRVAPAYSVRVGNEYVSYQTFEPFAGVLAAVADAVQDGNNPMTGVQKFALGIKDKSFFRSLEQVYDAVVASQDRWQERGGALVRDMLWTPMIPNVIRAPARALDEGRRREIGSRLEPEDFAFSAFPALGDEYAPPLRYDLWGREASKPGGSWVGRLLNPVPATRDLGDVERLDVLLARYHLDNPEASYLSAPALFVTRNKERIDWTEDEYARLARESGQAAIERLRPWAKGKESLTERDIEYIRRTLEAMRKRTAAQILKERIE